MMQWTRRTTFIAALVCAAPAFADTEVTLRARIEASGPAVTLGDVFDGAGGAGARAIAPAPAPGQIAQVSAQVLESAAAAAGLSWRAPAGMRSVTVVRPGGMRATLAPAQDGAHDVQDAAVRRGAMVEVVFDAPGLSLRTRARALESGAQGEIIRVVNIQSERSFEALVTGPGAVRANP